MCPEFGFLERNVQNKFVSVTSESNFIFLIYYAYPLLLGCLVSMNLIYSVVFPAHNFVLNDVTDCFELCSQSDQPLALM